MARPALTSSEVDSRRDEILDVAQHLFETQGLEAVSLRRIATQAGISPATPYRYFSNKDQVLVGLQIRIYNALGEILVAAASAETGATDKLRAIARSYISFAVNRPEAYSLVFRVPTNSDEQPQLVAARRAALDVCRQAFTLAEAEDGLHLRTDALTAAHLFWAAAHGAVSLQLAEQLVVGRTLEQIVPTLIATLMAGLTFSEDEA
ncbi:MAG: AcrR family transcriptional regulator [Hyphomicrobiaceae bacterium]